MEHYLDASGVCDVTISLGDDVGEPDPESSRRVGRIRSSLESAVASARAITPKNALIAEGALDEVLFNDTGKLRAPAPPGSQSAWRRDRGTNGPPSDSMRRKPRRPWAWPKGSPAEKEARAALSC